MKIYFAGSIRGGRDLVSVYQEIILLLKNYGEVLTEHIGNSEISSLGQQDKSSKEIFETDTNWVDESDVIVADVTVPSLGVGYELGRAEAKGKRIVCLYNGDMHRLSAMVGGNENFEIFAYDNVEDLKVLFEKLFV